MPNLRANPPGDQSQIKDLTDRCIRLAIIGKLIVTFDDPEERIDIIRKLLAGNLITGRSAELLLDNYVAGCD